MIDVKGPICVLIAINDNSTTVLLIDRRGHSSSSLAAMSRHDIIAHAAIGNWFAANGLDSTCITNSHPATMTWLDDGDG